MSLGDIIEFLRSRNVDVKTIEIFRDEKMDAAAVSLMTDEQIRETTNLRYGDLIALRIFISARGLASVQPGASSGEEYRYALLKRLNDRFKECGTKYTESATVTKEKCPMLFNQYGKKNTRRIELGWMDYDHAAKRFKQVRPATGGGTRHLVAASGTTMDELLHTACEIFFPDGQSQRGAIDDFDCRILNFDLTEPDPEDTVATLYEKKCVPLLRLCLSTKSKDTGMSMVSNEDMQIDKIDNDSCQEMEQENDVVHKHSECNVNATIENGFNNTIDAKNVPLNYSLHSNGPDARIPKDEDDRCHAQEAVISGSKSCDLKSTNSKTAADNDDKADICTNGEDTKELSLTEPRYKDGEELSDRESNSEPNKMLKALDSSKETCDNRVCCSESLQKTDNPVKIDAEVLNSDTVNIEENIDHDQPCDLSMHSKSVECVIVNDSCSSRSAKVLPDPHLANNVQKTSQRHEIKVDNFRPLGRLLHDLGLELVREQVYRDLIEIQTTKDAKQQLEQREKGQLVKLVEAHEKLTARNGAYRLEDESCVRCGFKCSSTNVMTLHQQYGTSSHLDANVHICCACTGTDGFRSRNTAHFIAHMSNEHGLVGRLIKKTSSFACANCPYEHKSSARLEAHTLKCSRKFSLVTNLQPLPGDCDIPLVYRPGERCRPVPNAFLQPPVQGQPSVRTLLSSLRAGHSQGPSLATLSNLICEICGKLVDGREALWSHFRTVHHVELGRGTMRDQDPWMKCDVCTSRFWTYQGLSRHLLLAHNRAIPAGNVSSASTTIVARCHLCGGSQTSNPLSHFSAYHNITLLEMYHAKMCCLCNRKLSSGRAFEEHMVEQHSDIFANYDVLRTVLQALTTARYFKTDDPREPSGRLLQQLAAASRHASQTARTDARGGRNAPPTLTNAKCKPTVQNQQVALNAQIVSPPPQTTQSSVSAVQATTQGVKRKLSCKKSPTPAVTPKTNSHTKKKRESSANNPPASYLKTPEKTATAEEVNKLYEDLGDIGRPILRSMRHRLSSGTTPQKSPPTPQKSASPPASQNPASPEAPQKSSADGEDMPLSDSCDIIPVKKMCLSDVCNTDCTDSLRTKGNAE